MSEQATNVQTGTSVAEGSIKAIYAANHTIELADGTQFKIPENVSTAELGVGDHIAIHYTNEGGDKVASTIDATPL